MGRKAANKKEVENKPEEVVEPLDPLQQFAVKPGRAVSMTQAASSMGDSSKNRAIGVSGRAKNSVCEIRRKKD